MGEVRARQHEAAFPGRINNGWDPQSGTFNEGLSVREYFAAEALRGLIAVEHHKTLFECGAPDWLAAIAALGRDAVSIADSTLAALAAGGGSRE